MIGDEVIHSGQTYISLINYNDCTLDNYLAWMKKEERIMGDSMNTMNTMEMTRVEKVETLKDIIQNISAINNEMSAQLQMIAAALVYSSRPTNDDKSLDEPLSIMDSIRHERDKAEENLKLLISIREYLW